jgi:hypothetical protein
VIGNDLHIIGAARHTLKKGAGKGMLPRFNQNETVAGSVLRSHTSGAALLLIKGSQVHVRSHVPLTPGRVVLLKVKSLSPIPVLKFLGETTPSARTQDMPVVLSALKGNIWQLTMDAILHSESGRQDLAKVLALMKEMIQGEFRNPGSNLLKLLISKSGLNLEAKLKKAILERNLPKTELQHLIESDLKGLLLKTVGLGKDGNGYLKRFLTAIKNFQLLNQNGFEQAGKVYLPIPMQFPDGCIHVGQLLLERSAGGDHSEEDGTGKEEVHQITFLLDMSRLGPMRAEIMTRGKHVKGNILVSTEKAKAIIKARLHSLVKTLSGRGLFINYLDCFVKAPEIVTAPLLNEIVQEENNSICLVA